jgi:hypothetical protein
MKWSGSISLTLATVAALFGVSGTPNAQAQEKKPNILVIMGDDVDWFNVGAYQSGRTALDTPTCFSPRSNCAVRPARMLEPCHRNKHKGGMSS